MFRKNDPELRALLERLDARVERIEQAIASIGRESELRAQLDIKRRELDALGEQSLHVVDQLDAALRKIREIERAAGTQGGGKSEDG